MKQEIVFTGKTVELALAEASEQLGLPKEELVYEVVEHEKQGFLGLGTTLAKIKVERSVAGELIAKEFVEQIMQDLEINASVEVSASKKSDRAINIVGDDAGILIGHHGDTLDALQYLTNLAANKREEDESRDYVHITVDVENYRAKREATLRSLARRMAAKVQKYKKSVMLEPMNPYERRIIHSEVQGIEGVSTNSIGAENNRRVVIYLESEGFSVPTRSERSSHSRAESGAADSSRTSDASRDGEKPVRSEGKRGEPRRKNGESRYADPAKKKKPVKPLYNDEEEYSEEEISNLISTYGGKDRTQREQPKKFKDFDEYLNSLLGTTGSDSDDKSDTDEDK